MPKPAKGQKFYAVQDGRETGVFLTWNECERHIKGYPGAKFKSFSNAADAEAFVSGAPSTAPSTSKHSPSSASTSKSKGKKRAMPQDVKDESGWDVVYCDGACKGNGKVNSIAGVGVWWEENDPRNIAERCPGDQTNNRAELIAIIRMLETTPSSKTPLLVKTDSQYTIKCFYEWLPKWADNGYRTSTGGSVKNLAVIQYLSALLGVRGQFGQTVHLQYVKGHSGDRGNDGADAQANLGALLPPVPERDWAKAEREVKERAEIERRKRLDKPIEAPLQVSYDGLPLNTESPRKLRKVSHELPFSRLSAPITKTPPPKIMHTGLQTHISPRTGVSAPTPRAPSRAPLTRTAPFSSLSPAPSHTPNTIRTPEILSPRATTEPTAVKAMTIRSPPPRKPSTSESQRFDSPSRRHGAGVFVKSPPQSPPGGRAKVFENLPSASERAKVLGLVPGGDHPPISDAVRKAQPPLPTKPVAMSVNKEDVNLAEYLDCIADDNDFSDDL
ncbi:hypothetical protein D9615_001108 [Tricholomella constricta]|uniref:ribonuclease H n=1 Tax=Tricholomella constricta TaxID=117010 RepID=A0A8H5HK95_9AGAR|nr:hypothetical protein D9615_001108 [Tricholomella constricta]